MTEPEAYDPKQGLERMKAEIKRLQGEHATVSEAVNRDSKEAQRAVEGAMLALHAIPEDEITEDHPNALAANRAAAEVGRLAKEPR